MAWCCFAMFPARALGGLLALLFLADYITTILVANGDHQTVLFYLYTARILISPLFFYVGYRIWRSRVTAAERPLAGYVDLEASSVPVLTSSSTLDEVKAFIEYQRSLNEVKQRAEWVVSGFAALAFIVQTACAVYIGIWAISSVQASNSDGFLFTFLIVLINGEYFLMKGVSELVTEDHGEVLSDLHLHAVFFTTASRMHRCDICSDRITTGEAYRCKTCDFDLCLKCYKRRHRGSHAAGIVSANVSLSTFFLRSLKLALAFWPLLVGALLSMIACQSVSLLNPSVQGRVFDSVIKGDQSSFHSLIVEYVIINAVLGLLSSLQSLSLELVGRRLGLAAREQLFKAIIRQDVAFFDSVHTGVLTSRLNNDVMAMVGPARTLLNDLLGNSMLMIGGGIMCLITDWRLTVLALTSVTPITYAYNVYYQWSRSLNRTIWSAISDANEVATEAFGNFRTVRAFGAERIEVKRFTDATGLANKAGTKAALIGATVKTYSRYVDAAASVLVLWYGGSQALSGTGEITLGKLIAFQLYWNILNSAFNSLSGVVGDLIAASSAAERVYSLMDAVPVIDGNSGIEVTVDDDRPSSVRIDHWSMRLENVSFSYATRPTAQVLSGVDLEIPSDKVTALVGRSGSGKTTLMHLLLRLYDPNIGCLFLGSNRLNSLSANSVRKFVGIVAQDTQLFAQSVFKNITYGIEREVTFEEVKAAAEAANAHEFINELEEGYDTKIGEKGVLLSGGQRQRIAIARCFLRKPKLLLLDEATSALDTENEALVQSAIDRLIAAGGCTVVLIAHRLSTVMNAHKIVVLSKGKVAEEGSHHQLVNKGGVYAQLVARQTQIDSDRIEEGDKEVTVTVDKLFDELEGR